MKIQSLSTENVGYDTAICVLYSGLQSHVAEPFEDLPKSIAEALTLRDRKRLHLGLGFGAFTHRGEDSGKTVKYTNQNSFTHV